MFVARLADLLDRDEEPDDPRRPRVCFDERPRQLLADRREPRAMAPGQPIRVDYEYTRHGTGNLFIMVKPLQGWLHLSVTPRRPKREFVHGMAELVDIYVPEAEQIRVA